MRVGFADSVVAHDTPLGFIWAPRAEESGLSKFEMVRRSETEAAIIDLAGRGADVEALCQGLSQRFGRSSVSRAIAALIHDGVLAEVHDSSIAVITGSRSAYYPLHLCAEVTSKCNLNCGHCYAHDEQRKVGDDLSVNARLLVQAIEAMARQGLQVVEFTGGECTLHPELPSIVQSVLGIDGIGIVALITNGTFEAQGLLEKLRGHSSRVVLSISLDSHVPEAHDAFRGVPGSWQQTVMTIREASRLGFRVRVAMCVTADTLFHIDETLTLAQSLGAMAFSWSPIFPIGRGHRVSKRLELAKKQVGEDKIAAYEMSVLEKHRDFLHTLDEDFVKYMVQKRANCGMGTRTWVMSPAGRVRPCTLMPEGFIDLGNAFEDGIGAVARHPALSALGRVRAPVYADPGCSECHSRLACNMCFFRAVISSRAAPNCSWLQSTEVRELMSHCDLTTLDDSNQCRVPVFE